MSIIQDFLQFSAVIATLIAIPLSLYLYLKALEHQSQNIKLNFDLKIRESDYESSLKNMEKSIDSILKICEFDIGDFNNKDSKIYVYRAIMFSNERLYVHILPLLDESYFVHSMHFNDWKPSILKILREEAAKIRPVFS